MAKKFYAFQISEALAKYRSKLMDVNAKLRRADRPHISWRFQYESERAWLLYCIALCQARFQCGSTRLDHTVHKEWKNYCDSKRRLLPIRGDIL